MTDTSQRPRRRKSPPVGLIVGIVVAVAAAGIAGALYLQNVASGKREPLSPLTARVAAAADCAWLAGGQPIVMGDNRYVVLSGAAGDPNAVVEQVHAGLSKGGYGSTKVDVSQLKPVGRNLCAALDALKGTKGPARPLVVARGAPYIIGRRSECPDAGAATVTGQFAKPGSGRDVALLHFGPDGKVETIFVGLAGFAAAQKANAAAGFPYKLHPTDIYARLDTSESYVATVCEAGAGSHGLLAIEGDKAFIAKVAGVKDAAGLKALNLGAAAGVVGQMDWHKVEE